MLGWCATRPPTGVPCRGASPLAALAAWRAKRGRAASPSRPSTPRPPPCGSGCDQVVEEGGGGAGRCNVDPIFLRRFTSIFTCFGETRPTIDAPVGRMARPTARRWCTWLASGSVLREPPRLLLDFEVRGHRPVSTVRHSSVRYWGPHHAEMDEAAAMLGAEVQMPLPMPIGPKNRFCRYRYTRMSWGGSSTPGCSWYM